MKKMKYGTILVYVICCLLTFAAFFAKDFVFYDFHMMPADYAYLETDRAQPPGASTSVWFTYGDDRELQYGLAEGMHTDDLRFYSKTHEGAQRVTVEELQPFRDDLEGYLIASLPVRQLDIDGDGEDETVYDSARADFSIHAYELKPRTFNLSELPFELSFEERKNIQVFYENRILAEAEVLVTGADGIETSYRTDSHGWIDGLPIRDMREGFTVAYAPNEEIVYRMYYALEDYDYFTTHFWIAQVPLLLILALTAIGIVIVCFLRKRYEKRNPAYSIYSRERTGIYPPSPLQNRTNSKFLLIRWLFLLFSFFFWTYFGKLISQGQVLNQVAVPVFSCPFNLDQSLESSCYYLTHLPVLFSRNLGYVIVFFVTLFLFLIFVGRILCGFMCPLGFVQDLMDKLRQALHIRPITVTDRMNKVIQPLKWLWIILFLGFVFVGGDFCDICPNKVFSPALGGWWVNYALSGFLTVALLIGSFFIKRFWCLMCPMGYLLGIFYKLNLFKLKKDCTSCTECGACYHACPMRIKSIYTERETEKVQTVDCLMCGECIHKCPEDNALSMTLCGKGIYKSSRKTFMSKFAPQKQKKEE